MENKPAKFLCSYGGEIQRQTHDNKLSYVGGHNKILNVNHSIEFPAMLAELSELCNAPVVFFKYQCWGDDLDTLISVTNGKDLYNLMLEYDQYDHTSATPPRMRLFLFLSNPPSNPGRASAQPDPLKPNSNIDNGAVVAAAEFHDPAPAPPEYQPRMAVNTSDRVVVSDPNVIHRLEFRWQLQAPAPEYQPRMAVNTSDRVVVSDPNANHGLEFRWQLQPVVDCASLSSASPSFGLSTPAPSFSSTPALSIPPAMAVDAKLETVRIGEEPGPGTLGLVDKPMNQWSLQHQFLPSKAGTVDAPTEKESTFPTSWGTPKAGCVVASSSSPSQFGPLTAKKTVFINYRGEDTGTNLVCHLRNALTQEGFEVFDDSKIVRGEKILTSLFTGIENSFASVVVLSKNYGLSKWCLRELVKIMECRKERGLIVLTVLYITDISHVRQQLDSFKVAFSPDSNNVDPEAVQNWDDALLEAEGFADPDSQSRCRDDYELNQKIVNYILQRWNYQPPTNDCKSLVGIYNNSAALELLQREAQQVGISGDETTKMIYASTISS